MFILNNMKTTTKINQKSFHGKTAGLGNEVLNINEFILFDMFGSPCRRVVMLSKFAGSLNMVF